MTLDLVRAETLTLPDYGNFSHFKHWIIHWEREGGGVGLLPTKMENSVD